MRGKRSGNVSDGGGGGGGWSASFRTFSRSSSSHCLLFLTRAVPAVVAQCRRAGAISQRQYCVVEVTTTAPSHTGCQANKLPLSLGDLFCHLFLLPCACLPACLPPNITRSRVGNTERKCFSTLLFSPSSSSFSSR